MSAARGQTMIGRCGRRSAKRGDTSVTAWRHSKNGDFSFVNVDPTGTRVWLGGLTDDLIGWMRRLPSCGHQMGIKEIVDACH